MKATVIFLFSLLLLNSCTDLSQYDKRSVNQAVKDSLTSKTDSWGVHMNLIEGGNSRILLTSPYAKTYQKKNGTETWFKGPVKIIVKDTTGKVTTTVSCNKAIYYGFNSEFNFSGNVIVKTDQKKKLRTEFLKWLQQKHDISTPNYVVITTPTDSITGFGLKGKQDLSTYTLKKITGQVSIK